MHGRAPLPRVGRGDAERRRRARGGSDAAVPRAGGPVVARGRHDEGVERHRTRGCGRERPVGERGERLDDTDERDPHRVVRVTVRVRVDGRLEPGEHLVRASVHRHAAVRVGLPARDADRKHGRPRRDAVDPGGAAHADHQPRELGAVPLGTPRLRRVLLRAGVASRLEHVQAGQEPPLQERVAGVDAGVEQGDRDAGAVDARERDLDPSSAPRREHVGLEDRTVLRDGRRIRGADGEHPLHRRVSLEGGQEPGVEGRREPVQHAHVGLLGLDRDAAEGEPCDRPLLGVTGSGRPDPHLDLAGPPTCRAHPVGERRRTEDDDPATAELRQRATAEKTLPALRAGRLLGGGAAGSVHREQPAAEKRREREQRRGRPLRSTRTSTHRGQGSREM